MSNEPVEDREINEAVGQLVTASANRGHTSRPPKGYRRKKSLSEAEVHLLVASTSAFMAPPPFVCVRTGPPPYPCLRYGRDPLTGQYNIPPRGELVDCATCRDKF